ESVPGIGGDTRPVRPQLHTLIPHFMAKRAPEAVDGLTFFAVPFQVDSRTVHLQEAWVLAFVGGTENPVGPFSDRLVRETFQQPLTVEVDRPSLKLLRFDGVEKGLDPFFPRKQQFQSPL